MKIKQLSIVVILTLFASNVFSQEREYSGFFDSYYYKGKQNFNFTVNGGLNVCLCDMAKLEPGPSFGVGVNYKLWPRVMFGTEFHWMRLSGKDNMLNRNLSFSTVNLEFLGYGRFYLIDDIIRVARDRGKESRFLKIYLMTGIGFSKFDAEATFTKPYPETDSMFLYDEKGGGSSLIIPAALGFSWRISNRISLITELGYRLTFTDRLDGISARANPDNNDGYPVLDLKLQISPFAKAKKKKKKLSTPEKYEGPKGTETWKNRKKEEPPQKNNYYYEEEETPQEEQQFDEYGNPIEPAPQDDLETPQEDAPLEEEPLPDGWD